MHHHYRRKSGHASGNSSMTDVRKATTASRPNTMTRRTTPQTVQKLGKNPRDREREWEEERWWDEERESFPQYWYVCRTLSLHLGVLHYIFINSLSLPPPHQRDFLFSYPAASPDMQVIRTTREMFPMGGRGTPGNAVPADVPFFFSFSLLSLGPRIFGGAG